ncbi:MAG: sodium:solute symporter [Flavobacteriaceae bacterium]|nr:MAG: sodium:solute symporter [Flavobacteriaceae bacterium]
MELQPQLILWIIAIYFLILVGVSYLTSRNSTNEDFFKGSNKSPWLLVAIGMIGNTISGVTFISVPGGVLNNSMSYLQLVLGNMVGYFVVALVLLPLYYRLNLTSIYSYLNERFGKTTYQTTSGFFLVSKLFGAAARLYLVAKTLQLMAFDSMGIPFWITATVSILLIWVYTFQSGIKTIVWTDSLQTIFLLTSLFLTLWLVSKEIGIGCLGDMENFLKANPMSKVFFFEDFADKKYFWKNFLSGIFLSIAMVGLDQDMMQKNLSCKNIEEAQTNMFTFSMLSVFVNFVFLVLGVMLYAYANLNGIDKTGDELFPFIAKSGELGLAVGIFFVVGLVAAAYSSADSALTALTTSFSVDILDIKSKNQQDQTRIRKTTHIAFSVLLILVILAFNQFASKSVIDDILKIAGYTYGPILGLFTLGIFSERKLPVGKKSLLVVLVMILSPFITYHLNNYLVAQKQDIGFAVLLLNALITICGLFLISKSSKSNS